MTAAVHTPWITLELALSSYPHRLTGLVLPAPEIFFRGDAPVFQSAARAPPSGPAATRFLPMAATVPECRPDVPAGTLTAWSVEQGSPQIGWARIDAVDERRRHDLHQSRRTRTACSGASFTQETQARARSTRTGAAAHRSSRAHRCAA